jgi:hypothetical protein
MKPVISLEWISRVGERQRVTPQEIHAPIAGLLRWRRWRLSVNLLQRLNSVVQGGHHLHLELEELLRSQRWRHWQRLVDTLDVLPLLARTGAAPAGQNRCQCSWCSPSVCSRTKFIRGRYCTILERKLWQDKVESKECTVLPPPTVYLHFIT